MSLESYKSFFLEADKDNSGFLTFNELSAVFRSKGYKGGDDKLKSMFGAADLSGDDKISLDEYLMAMGQLPPKEHKEASMRSCFRSFDTDNSGSIDKKELSAVFAEMGKHLSEEELQRMIELADQDSSGTIGYEEFIREIFGQE
jgi:Ca2+-binding EF-hand superfamily protein